MPISPKFRTSHSLGNWAVVLSAVLIVSLLFLFVRPAEDAAPGLADQQASSFGELIGEAIARDQLALLHFQAPHCYPCDHWLQQSLQVEHWPESLRESFQFYQVDAFDAQGEGRTLRTHYEVTELPSLLVLDTEGRELTRFSLSLDRDQLWQQLELMARLREAPAMEPSQANVAISESGRYTLAWEQYENLPEAQYRAEALSMWVAEPVWVQPGEGQEWVVCSGNFSSAKQAQVAQRFHQEWEQQEVTIVPLLVQQWTIE